MNKFHVFNLNTISGVLIKTLIEPLCLFWSIIVVVFSVIVYFLINAFLPGKISSASYMYLVQPLLWLNLGSFAWFGWHLTIYDKPKIKQTLLWQAVLLAFFQVAFLLLAGLLFGFGYSPYGRKFLYMLGNLMYLTAMLASVELTRAYLIISIGRRYTLLAFIFVTLFMTILNTPLDTILHWGNIPNVIQIAGRRFLPDLAENLLASLLAFVGGPVISFTYRMILHGFQWLSPILPDLDWFVSSFLGTLLPAFGMILIYNRYYAQPAVEPQPASTDHGSFVSWATVSVITLALIGLNTGLFGFRPSLVASGSMTPKYQVGDIIITRDVPASEVRVGDVISYKTNGTLVIHRVKRISTEGGQISFITQGDANTTPDPPVSIHQYQGKVVAVIPKVGWVSIFFRNVLTRLAQ